MFKIQTGKIVSFLIFLSYVIILPAILKLFWPVLLSLPGANNQLIFYLICAIGASNTAFWTYNLVMWYIYTAKIPFFQQYRCNDKPWPWEVDSKMWRETLKKTLMNVIINICGVSSLFLVIHYYLGKPTYEKSLEKWPSSLTITGQLIFCLLMEDLTFYWSHSLFFHNPKFYWLHKAHHQYTTSISLSALYAHPFEFMFGNVLQAGIGYAILGKFVQVHYVTIMIWFAFRLNEATQIHSGYDWSWSHLSFLPFKAGPEHHHFHHYFNTGNLGSIFEFWDIIMKTNKQFLIQRIKGRQE